MTRLYHNCPQSKALPGSARSDVQKKCDVGHSPLQSILCIHSQQSGFAIQPKLPVNESPSFHVATGLDEASYNALVAGLLELKEFSDLEKCPGRSSWLSEIIEGFGVVIARLEPSHERVSLM